MIDTIFIEEQVLEHERTREILARHPRAARVVCDHYGEVFNPRAQNFRLQKQRPAMILARKHANHVLETPPGYGIGGARNFYFSHMLNCVYDCRYCFLQGMYRSAHYVVFVNYEDFADAIRARLDAAPGEEAYFFSGYDCDSLVFDATTDFTGHFLPLFERLDGAWLELRTKSVALGALLERPAMPNVIVAFSLTPEPIAAQLEHGAPPVARRIDAMQRLAERGWRIGLRFDPLIHDAEYRRLYGQLFASVFARVDAASVHSVSLGPLRFPKQMYDDIVKLYPDAPLFAGSLTRRGRMVSYAAELETEMHAFCGAALADRVPTERMFDCVPEVAST